MNPGGYRQGNRPRYLTGTRIFMFASAIAVFMLYAFAAFLDVAGELLGMRSWLLFAANPSSLLIQGFVYSAILVFFGILHKPKQK